MLKIAIVVLANTETHEDMGRVVNAMMAVKEFHEAGDDVKLFFDGAATKWPGVLSDANHKYHKLFDDIKDCIVGACGYCAHAFHVDKQIENLQFHLLDEYNGHLSFRQLVKDGYQIITF